MLKFIIKRLGWIALTLWMVFTISFFLMKLVPGGPFDSERQLEPAILANMERQYHLDEPLWRQYLRALSDTLRGDLGYSYRIHDFSVNEIVAEGLPISAGLGVMALGGAIVVGVCAGIVSAARRGSALDLAMMSLATVGIALPSFVIAGLMLLAFVFYWPLFPAAGWGTARQLVLPAFCLGAPYAAYIARLMRTGMLDVLGQDYIRTAVAKGLSPRAVIFRHALRGALLPLVSFLGPATAGILTGSLIVERVFAIPGLGAHFVRAAEQRDYTLAMGMILLYCALLSCMNLLVDVAYALLDPRVSLEQNLMAMAPVPDVEQSADEAILGGGAPLGGAGGSPWRTAWRRLRKNRAALAALGYLLALVVAAVLTPLWPLQSPYRVATARVLEGPSAWGWRDDDMHVLGADGRLDDRRVQAEFRDLARWQYPLLALRAKLWGSRSLTSICGTDELGRDVLARVFWGARISLLVALVGTSVSLMIGVTYGAVAGYCGGRLDNAMMRLVDVLYSLPLIFIVIFLITFLNEPKVETALAAWGIDRLTIFFIVVGAVQWLTMARVIRGQVLSLKNEQFVEAAQALGASRARIIFRHLVPNTMNVVIVYLTLTIPQVMLLEAFLSFLGLGVQAPQVSWGVLASQGFRVITPARTFWWLILYPGLAVGLTLFALNFLGDGLRDALDPKLRRRGAK